MPTPLSTPTAITSSSRARSWTRRAALTPRRTSGSVIVAAMSCRGGCWPLRVGGGGWGGGCRSRGGGGGGGGRGGPKQRLDERRAQEARPIPAARRARVKEV